MDECVFLPDPGGVTRATLVVYGYKNAGDIIITGIAQVYMSQQDLITLTHRFPDTDSGTAPGESQAENHHKDCTGIHIKPPVFCC